MYFLNLGVKGLNNCIERVMEGGGGGSLANFLGKLLASCGLGKRDRGYLGLALPWVPEVTRSRRAGAENTGGGGLGARPQLSESE